MEQELQNLLDKFEKWGKVQKATEIMLIVKSKLDRIHDQNGLEVMMEIINEINTN